MEEEIELEITNALSYVRPDEHQLRVDQVDSLFKLLSKCQTPTVDYPLDSLLISALRTSRQLSDPWDSDTLDLELAHQWQALEELPWSSLGRQVARFYQNRGFTYPGLPGAVPPLLAQHDFVHVIADYGTRLESELEVFALIAWSGADVHAFSLLEAVMSLFGTGTLKQGLGAFKRDPGHLDSPGMGVRLGDALRRGAQANPDADLLRVDWFTYADWSLAQVRRHFGIAPKSYRAILAGSAGPWQHDGITANQRMAAQ